MLPFLQSHQDGAYLQVKLQPRASRNEIGRAEGNELKIKVTAPPVDAAANEALIKLLAETLNCPRNVVVLVRGKTSRHKLLFLRGQTAESVAARLGMANPGNDSESAQ
ncbi:MAG: DUF167 domain-containing protein [Verrucomicrobiia bacterium]